MRIESGKYKVPRDVLDGYLKSHFIDPAHLRSDDFGEYFNSRKSVLLNRIQTVMGKQIASDDIEDPDEVPKKYELVQEDSQVSGSGDTLTTP